MDSNENDSKFEYCSLINSEHVGIIINDIFNDLKRKRFVVKENENNRKIQKKKNGFIY